MFDDLLQHHHRLLPMELISIIPATIIILITVIIGTRVEAIQFDDSFPSSSFSTVISSEHHGPKNIFAGIRIRRSASSYLVQRLRNLRRGRKWNDLQTNDVRNENDLISSQKFMDNNASLMNRRIQTSKDRFAGFHFSSYANNNIDKKQQAAKSTELLQQAQNLTLTDSSPIQLLPKSVLSNFPRLTNRQDCNGSDCLKNNDAISLYIPRENNSNDGQPPPLLLLSNNPSSSNNRKNRNSQQGTTVKLSKLHTGIKVLGPDIQQFEKPIPLSQSDTSYHISQTNSRSHGEYGTVKLSEVEPIPPFAGGAELTDFIQPIDTSMQTHRLYEDIIPSTTNHISSATYYGKNKHYLLSPSGNRGIYGDYHPAPFIPFSSKLEIYEPLTLSSPPPVYSTHSDQSTDHLTSSSHYGSEYDIYSVSFNFNQLFHFLIVYMFGFFFLINFPFFLQTKRKDYYHA